MHFDAKVMILRKDNGIEYMDGEFPCLLGVKLDNPSDELCLY